MTKHVITEIEQDFRICMYEHLLMKNTLLQNRKLVIQ